MFSNIGNNLEKPSAWNTWTWQQQQQWNWNWATTAGPPPKAPIVEPVNSIRPPFVAPPILTEPPPFPVASPNKQFPPNVSFDSIKKSINYSIHFTFLELLGRT